MAHQNESTHRLVESIANARTWLSKLDEATVREKPTPDRWSIAEVIGHLIDSACNNHQRFIRAQDVESLEFPKYDQNRWVANGDYDDSPWLELVELWSLYNLQLARIIARIPDDQLETPCTISPYEPCKLGFLVSDYVDHHLAKIQERIAER